MLSGHQRSCRFLARVKVDSRLAPCQWETSLQSNTVSHWPGANQESAPEELDGALLVCMHTRRTIPITIIMTLASKDVGLGVVTVLRYYVIMARLQGNARSGGWTCVALAWCEVTENSEICCLQLMLLRKHSSRKWADKLLEKGEVRFIINNSRVILWNLRKCWCHVFQCS